MIPPPPPSPKWTLTLKVGQGPARPFGGGGRRRSPRRSRGDRPEGVKAMEELAHRMSLAAAHGFQQRMLLQDRLPDNEDCQWKRRGSKQRLGLFADAVPY